MLSRILWIVILIANVNVYSELLTPKNIGGDGNFTTTTLSGETVHQTINGGYLYVDVPAHFGFTTGERVYLKVTYHMGGDGYFDIQYDGVSANFKTSETKYHSSRTGNDKFADAYFTLDDPEFLNQLNGQTDFRIRTVGGNGTELSVKTIELLNVNFTGNATWDLVLSSPWLGAGDDFTRAASDVPVDTIHGQVVVGYQGWFKAPNDPDTGSWRHWVGNNSFTPENFSIDMWPYNEEYDFADLTRAGTLTTASGKNAYVFSSAQYGIVDTHFRWMKENGISGAFLQRFLSANVTGAGSEPEFVLYNVMKAANAHGRTWCIEYDVSEFAKKGDQAIALSKIQADWNFLKNDVGILNDASYLHQGSKPVVVIYGLATPHKNEAGEVSPFTVAQADAIQDLFQDGNIFLIGAVPTDWRNLTANNNHHAGFQNHYSHYDMISVWNPHQDNYAADNARIDAIAAAENVSDIAYLPHTRPGFSWTHLKNLVAGSAEDPYWPRYGGENQWDKTEILDTLKPEAIFMGMMDEYDEGTAVMPMADDHPAPHTQRRFLNNEGQDKFRFLKLTGAMGAVLRGNLATDSTTAPSNDDIDAAIANLVANGSFELGSEFWTIDATYHQSSTSHPEDRSKTMKVNPGSTGVVMLKQTVLVEPGESYDFYASAYKVGNAGTIVMDMNDVAGEIQKVVGNGTGAGLRHVAQGTWVNTANVTEVTIRLFVLDSPTDKIYFDNVSLRKVVEKKDELVNNGNFETAGAAGWKINGSLNEYTTDFAHKGTGALKSKVGGSHAAYQVFYIKPNTDYDVSASIYKGSTAGLHYLDMNDIAGELTLYGNVAGGWDEVSGTWNSGANTYLRIRSVANSARDAESFIDKISVKGDAPVNLLVNGDFEDGATGWNMHANHATSSSTIMGSGSIRSTVYGVGSATTQTVTVEANTTYRLQGFIYKKNDTGVAYIDMADIPGELSLDVNGTGGGNWTHVSGTWNSGANTSITIRCISEGNLTDEVRFDGIMLEKL